MTPARLAWLAKTAVAVAQHRGRTVPAIREGGPHDGRREVEGDSEGFRIEEKSQ